MISSEKVILITGASSGIGQETALQLATQGHQKLALAARRQDRLNTLAKKINSETSSEALPIPTDLMKRKDIEKMIESTLNRFGKIDVLINNAGILFMQPFTNISLEEIEKLMNTNFIAVLHSIQGVLPIMEKQKSGHIINIGSAVGRRGLPFMGVYTATKFAMTGLTESIRLELASKNINFTQVYPGAIETDMPRQVDRSKLPNNYPSHDGQRIPVQRAAQAIVKAIKKKPLEVYVPWWIRYAAWLSVVFPSLADFLIRKSFKNSLK